MMEEMTNLITTKNNHMSLDDRIEIQNCLYNAMTFKAISKQIVEDQTTVSKEVKKHILIKENSLIVKNTNGSEIDGAEKVV
jgi:IS30 family transposase